MAYHLIPFVAGAVVGGLAVYLFGDERARQNLRQSADNLSRKAQRTAGQVSEKVTDGFAQVRESLPGRGGATDPAPEREVEVPAPKASARRTTSRRSPARATTRKTAADKGETPANPDKPEDA